MGKHNRSYVGTAEFTDINWLPVEHRVAQKKLNLVTWLSVVQLNLQKDTHMNRQFDTTIKRGICMWNNILFVHTSGLNPLQCEIIWNKTDRMLGQIQHK